jgi:hypothetical protein
MLSVRPDVDRTISRITGTKMGWRGKSPHEISRELVHRRTLPDPALRSRSAGAPSSKEARIWVVPGGVTGAPVVSAVTAPIAPGRVAGARTSTERYRKKRGSPIPVLSGAKMG